jgi:hypothetical protein
MTPVPVQGPEFNWTEEPQEIQTAPVTSTIAEPAGVGLAKHRETTRSALALWLMFLLTLIVVGLLVLAGVEMAGIVKSNVLSVTDLATAVLMPIVTLAGTALGFYFGAQTAVEDGSSGTPGLARRAQARLRQVLRRKREPVKQTQ